MLSHCLDTDFNLQRSFTGSLERMLKMRSRGRVGPTISKEAFGDSEDEDFLDSEEEGIIVVGFKGKRHLVGSSPSSSYSGRSVFLCFTSTFFTFLISGSVNYTLAILSLPDFSL